MIDVRTYGAIPDGTTDCITSINAALIDGDIILQNGIFLIGSPIVIPSNRTVYGKNCELFAKNETYDNMFRNSDFVNGNSNCNIKGLGNFCINGNSANNTDAEYDYWVQGGEHFNHAGMYHYAKIQFYNVAGFEISGVKNICRPAFFMNIAKSYNGIIDDVFLNIDYLAVNQDGIAIRQGCHDIKINNIYGHSGDDFISLNALEIAQWNPIIEGQDQGDISDIEITNIIIGKSNIHDIIIDGVDVLTASSALGFGAHTWAINQPTKDETYNFTVNNLKVKNASVAAIILDQSCKDVAITNLTNDSASPDFVKTYGTQENITINGVTV